MGIFLARHTLGFSTRSWAAVSIKQQPSCRRMPRLFVVNNHAMANTGAEKATRVYFKAHDVYTDALPGENILEVALRCGIDIPTGCLRGSCGTCEVEVTKYDNDQDSGEPSVSVVRACTAGIPRGFHLVEVDDIEDPIWGVDGMDL